MIADGDTCVSFMRRVVRTCDPDDLSAATQVMDLVSRNVYTTGGERVLTLDWIRESASECAKLCYSDMMARKGFKEYTITFDPLNSPAIVKTWEERMVSALTKRVQVAIPTQVSIDFSRSDMALDNLPTDLDL